MKLIRFSKDKEKKYILLGDDSTTAQWYTVDEKVKGFVNRLSEGDEVTVKSIKKENANHLIFIQKGSGNGVHAPSLPKVEVDNPAPNEVHNTVNLNPPTAVEKAPEVKKEHDTQTSIKRQAIIHAVSRTMISLQGQVAPEAVFEYTTRLYAHYLGLVG